MNEGFLVKITNSNVMPTLHGFRWYLYFEAQVRAVGGVVASEQSILNKNQAYKSFLRVTVNLLYPFWGSREI